MSHRAIIGFTVPLLAMSLACSLPTGGAPTEGSAPSGGETGGQPAETRSPDEPAGGSRGSSTPGIPLLPVPINQGLASLNSYTMTYTNDVYELDRR